MVRTAPLTRAALFACCLFSSLVVAATDSDNFHQALDAARNDDWETLSRQQQALGDQHPCKPIWTSTGCAPPCPNSAQTK